MTTLLRRRNRREVGSRFSKHGIVCSVLLYAAVLQGCNVAPVDFRTLTVEAPEGGRILLPNAPGIDCGEDCEEAFAPGTEVTLQARANPGWFFRRWEGDCSEQSATCRIILDRDARVFAVFRQDNEKQELAVQVSGQGNGRGVVTSNPPGIECPGTACFGLFPKDRRVRLDAVPDELSEFDSWTGACTSTSSSCYVRLGEDKVVSASFRPRQVSLGVALPVDGSVVSNPPGISCPGSCSAEFTAGSNVTLTAIPGPEADFKSWSGACSGPSTSCDVRLTKNTTVAAEFLGMRTVSIKFLGDGQASVISFDGALNCEQDCSTRYKQGTDVSLGATARFGSRLIGWKSVCPQGTAQCTFTVQDDAEVQLESTLDDFPLEITKLGDGSGRVVSTGAGIDCGGICTATVSYFTRVSLTAEPEPGTEFAGWSGGCLGGSPVCLVTMTGPIDVTAYFIPQFVLTVSNQGQGSGVVRSDPAGIDCDATCDGFFARNARITLEATPNRGSYFIGWSGACSGTGPCVVTLDQSRTVDAQFGLLDYTTYTFVGGTGVGTITSTEASIDCPGDLTAPFETRSGACSSVRPFGSQVTYRAEPAPGSEFVGWSGADCDDSNTRCTVSVVGDSTLGAIFRPRYKLVRAASFLRGSPNSELGRDNDESPQLPLSVSHSLWFKETEVTVEEWMRVMGSEPSPAFSTNCTQNCPVQGVSWGDAVSYTNALSKMEGLPTCYWPNGDGWTFAGLDCAGYRLPSEAEWELAARGGSSAAFATGGLDNPGDVCIIESNLSLLGWYCGNTIAPRAVAGLNPNAFGLYDMHGNVSEWTNDVYSQSYYATVITSLRDPPGPSSMMPPGSENRVARGGSFSDYARDCRSANRLSVVSSTRSASIGFRPVRSDFAVIHAGSFTMGSESTEVGNRPDESPKHKVLQTRPYLIERNELTQAQWAAYFSSNPNPSFFSTCGQNCPVETISYSDSISYLNELSTAHNRTPCYVQSGGTWVRQGCNGYRLPTEAEWERAARAGDKSSILGSNAAGAGCGDPNSDNIGWYCYNSGNQTREVGQKQPNALGMYDTHGNVSEWVSDWYDAAYYTSATAVDPSGPVSGTERVVRGGSWSSPAQDMRFAFRNKSAPQVALLQVGMRKVQEYCPTPGTTSLTTNGRPSFRERASITAMGDEIVVYGGLSLSNALLNNGAIYNTRSHQWRPLVSSLGNIGRAQHGAAWTGRELIFWGGTRSLNNTSALADGLIYSPATDSWSLLPPGTGSPAARFDHEMLWTGRELIVWGGANNQSVLNTGARYLPESNTWLPMSQSSLSPRTKSASLWTGDRMFVFGGRNISGGCSNTYAFYDPAEDTWSQSLSNSAGCGCSSEAFLFDRDIVVVSENAWCQYNLDTKQWSTLPARPGGRAMPGPNDLAVASSSAELFAYGGSPQVGDAVVDAYQPVTGQWRATGLYSGTSAHMNAKGIWDGCGFFTWTSNESSSGELTIP